MSGKKLFYLVLAAYLASLLVFMLGCSPEKEAKDKQDKSDIKEYKIEVQAEPEDAGEIVVSGDGTYEAGRTAILNAEPKTGMGFKGWKNDEGEIVSTDENYYFEVKEDKDLVAQFADLKRINLEVSNNDKGSVEGSGYYEYGDEVFIQAEPETGVEFKGWKNENGEIISTNKQYRFEVKEVKEDKDLIAQFANLKEGVAIIEKHDDVNWSLDEVLELSKEAFSVYFDTVRPAQFASDAKEKLNQGDLNIHYPGIKDYEIEIKEIIKDKDEIKVKSQIHYPHVDNETFDELKEEIRDEVLAKTNDEAFNLRAKFSNVLEEANLSKKSTTKTLVIEKQSTEEKENEDNAKVVDIDSPKTLLASFHELYKQAIAQHIQDVVVEIRKDEEKERYKKITQAKLFDKEAKIRPAIDPHYLLDETTLVLPDENKISLEKVWSQLTENVDYNPHLDLSPEAYFHNIQLSDTNREGKQPIRFTRRYMVATMDSVIGYIDTNSEEINLFTKISSGGVSDFYWSPNGEYISYYFMQSGSGHGFLHVYDVAKDEVIEVSELDEFKEKYDLELDRGGFIGEFKNLTWSEDGEELYFETESRDNKITSWIFNIKEMELILDH